MLTAAAKAALDAGASYWFVVEFQWPDGTVGRYCDVDLHTPTGLYKGIASNLGSYTRQKSDDEGNVVAPSGGPITLLDVPDVDGKREIADVVAAEGDVIGVVVTVRMVVGGLGLPDWDTVFLGIVTDHDEGDFSWTFAVSFDDHVLDSDVPPLVPRYDFEAAEEVVAPIMYGRFDSSGLGGGGMVGPLSVASVANPDFFFSRANGSLTRIYAAGVDVTPGGGGVDYPRPNGRLYTIVEGDELSPPVTDVSKAITADGFGQLTAPISQGLTLFLIELPTEQLDNFLNNFVYGIYGSGLNWIVGLAPIHAGYLAETAGILARLGFKSSRNIKEKTKARNVVAEWARSHGVKWFWTADGKMAFRIFDDSVTGLYTGLQVILWDRDEIGRSASIDYSPGLLVDAVVANYLLNEVKGKYAFSVEVGASFPHAGATIKMDLPWSPSYLT